MAPEWKDWVQKAVLSVKLSILIAFFERFAFIRGQELTGGLIL